MSKVIAYAIQKTNKGINKIKINKSIDELDSNDPIQKMCITEKTPNGKKLMSCIFHSYCSEKPVGDERTYEYCLEGLNDYAICTDNYNVLDLCYIKELEFKEQQERKIIDIRNKVAKFDHNMEVTYRIHDEFMINIERRKQLMNYKSELEKIHGETEKVEESPEYMTLYQILQRAEESFEALKQNLEKIYNLKPQEISKDEFINQHIKDDIEKVNKARENLIRYRNKFQKKPLSQGQERILGLETQINIVNKLLKNTFETPLVYIYKATKALEELERWYRKDYNKVDFYNSVCYNLEKCNKFYLVYKEFFNENDIQKIIDKVEKEQRDAAEDERRNKQARNIKSVKTGSQGFVVKMDGTVIKDESTEPKLIIGKTVTGRIEDEKWNSIRR